MTIYHISVQVLFPNDKSPAVAEALKKYFNEGEDAERTYDYETTEEGFRIHVLSSDVGETVGRLKAVSRDYPWQILFVHSYYPDGGGSVCWDGIVTGGQFVFVESVDPIGDDDMPPTFTPYVWGD